MDKRLKFLVVICFLPFMGFGQQKSALACQFEQLFLSGNMVKWEQLVDSLQRAKLDKQEEEILLYAEYGIIGYFLAKHQKEKAAERVEQFENHIRKMLLREPANADYLAFDAALVGFKIGLNPWKAPFLGPQSTSKVEKALRYRKNELMPLTEQANSLYFRPAFVGGDKKKAKLMYEKAFKLHGETNSCSWRYYSMGSWLGQVYTKLGETQKAREIYLLLLKNAPDFKFVKNELLPQLEQGKFNDVGARFEKMLE